MESEDPSVVNRPHNERWFYRVMYSASTFDIVCRLQRLLGRRFYRVSAGVIAWVYAKTQIGVRQTVLQNLRLLKTSGVSDADATKVFVNFAQAIADYFSLARTSVDAADAWCVERLGRDHLDEARRHGRGAVLATGHYGFFEFGALLIGRMGWEISVVTMSEPTPALTDWRAAYRGRWGAKTIEIGSDAFSSLRVMKALESGQFAAMLMDRPFGDFAVEVGLPGGVISFSKSPALIAYLSDAPLVPVVVAALGRGKYKMIAMPCIWPRRLGLPRDEAVTEATRQAARALVDAFAEDITQWYQFARIQ
ncbi:MAG: lysophospholipid acyltransferase family protein [Chthoniobacterales bacterium]